MDANDEATKTASGSSPGDEAEARSPKQTLQDVIDTCQHALKERIAKRYSTRDALKSLERRAQAHIKKPWDSDWHEEAGKIVVAANAVFDQVIAEVPAAHA
jgi:hypothetical protein